MHLLVHSLTWLVLAGPPSVPRELDLPPTGENGLAILGYQLRMSERIRAACPWRESLAAALDEARAENKLVLALVEAEGDPRIVSPWEAAFAECVWLEPSMAEWVLTCCVPVRVTTRAHEHLATRASAEDSLRALGTDHVEARSPAIVVATPAGEALGVLASVGSWSPDLLARFLIESMGKRAPLEWSERGEELARFRLARAIGDDVEAARLGGRLLENGALESARDRVGLAAAYVGVGRAADAIAVLEGLGVESTRSSPSRDSSESTESGGSGDSGDSGADRLSLDPALRSEAEFWRAGAIFALGDEARARELWTDLRRRCDDRSPWGPRAELHAYWHERVVGLSAFGAPRLDSKATTTERARPKREASLALATAVDFLLASQRVDGRFAHASDERYDGAVTALATEALDRSEPFVEESTRPRVARARERATAWMAAWIERAGADTERADSWSAAYVLAEFARRAERDDVARAAVPAAIELLFATQLSNGGWSYDARFGNGWKGGFAGWPKSERGRAHSINTALALWAAARARDAGFELPSAALAVGLDTLATMRSGETTLTYTWPTPINFEGEGQSLGRAAVSLQALVAFERAKPKSLDRALAEFDARHRELHATVKLTSAWMGPGNTSSYFFLQSFLHAADAFESRGGRAARASLERLRDELLRVGELDGTWLDYELSGKVYGTAMALGVLARARAASR